MYYYTCVSYQLFKINQQLYVISPYFLKKIGSQSKTKSAAVVVLPILNQMDSQVELQ